MATELREFNIEVGARIRKYRREKGITIQQMADAMGVTVPTAQKYEVGGIKHFDVEMLKKIANAIDVYPEKLTGWGTEYTDSIGKEDGKLLKAYDQLTQANKSVVFKLIDALIEAQNQQK